jgi:hypothetical protein
MEYLEVIELLLKNPKVNVGVKHHHEYDSQFSYEITALGYALRAAASKTQTAILELLLQHGANPNNCIQFMEKNEAEAPLTALHLACKAYLFTLFG